MDIRKGTKITVDNLPLLTVKEVGQVSFECIAENGQIFHVNQEDVVSFSNRVVPEEFVDLFNNNVLRVFHNGSGEVFVENLKSKVKVRISMGGIFIF